MLQVPRGRSRLSAILAIVSGAAVLVPSILALVLALVAVGWMVL